jgi:hypothetical protein
MPPTLALAAILCAAATPTLLARQVADDAHAGFVDVDWSKAVGGKEPSVQVRLERPLLRMMASATKQVDPDVVALVDQLTFVRVNVYEDIQGGETPIAQTVDAEVKSLAGKGWSPVAKVRQDDDRVDVLMKADGDKIVGFAVFVAGESELVFVNVAGDMDPETFGEKLGAVVAKLSGGELNLGEMSGLLESLTGSNAAGDGDQ